MRILGIDPGSITTGFGIIHTDTRRYEYISSGCIKTGTGVFAVKLKTIYSALTELVRDFKPDYVAIEKLFMHKNVASLMKLVHARGAAIVAAANFDLSIAEYSPRQIKKAVVGYGAASKRQVQHMVQTLLKLDNLPSTDAADALAVAICHVNNMGTYRK